MYRYIGIHVVVALATACEHNDTRGSDTDGATGGASSSEAGDPPEAAAVTDAATTNPTSGTSGSTDGTTGDDGGWDEDGFDEFECDDELPPKQLAPEDDDDECNVEDEYRLCDEQPGTQFCQQKGEDWVWGPCLEEYDCIPGDYSVCIYCDEDFGTILNYCYTHEGVPSMVEGCDTPLVLRLDEHGVEFSASTDRFAISPGGGCSATDWPGAATPWLALDLDRSGSIDGGHELFGSGTRVGPTRATDGFIALAMLDSDDDRRITPADARWSELLLWSDHDQDRRSTLWELAPLASLRITAIDLQPTRSPGRCDARGNCEIERAGVTFVGPDGAPRIGEVIDVRLACQ